jgi:hypothetical protein
MNWMLRTLWLLLLSQCKPWLPLLAAGPQQEAINFQVQDTVQPPAWISTPPVVNPLPYEHLIPLPEYHWQPQFISNQPFFTVSLPDPKIDSLRKVVDSMAGLQRAQLRQDSLLRVQLKTGEGKARSLQQANDGLQRQSGWYRTATATLGALFAVSLFFLLRRKRTSG